MQRLVIVGVVTILSACWVDDQGVCHLQPSEYVEHTFDQNCGGVTRTWSTKVCNFDEDAPSPQRACEQACATPATCTLRRSALAGGTCSATICGG